MVDDPATNELICWSKDGETFLVPNHVRFGDEVLPRFFKHNRFSSFVRQLNMYGFHKVPHLQQGALKSDSGQETELWEFKNDNFKRDRPELLLNMQRKKGVRNEDETGKGKGKEHEHDEGGTPLDDVSGALMRQRKTDSETGALQLASVWSAIQSIQSAQQGINDNLRHLHNSNNELFREAAEQRERTQKQEETINKMLRFLAGVFGAQDVGGLASGEKRGAQGNSTGQGDAGARRRRVVVRPSFSKGKSGRLLIGDSSMTDGEADDQIEELELPMEDEGAANIEELSPFSRSNTNSPKGGTSPQHQFSYSGSPESKTQDLPSISSEVTATPGGGRRISQQAGTQILSALASGDGSAWLANLFGQQQQQGSGQGGMGSDKSVSTPGGSSFKLDSQTLATLQSVLGGMTNSENGPGSNNSYFGAAGAANTGNSAAAWTSAQQPSVPASAQPWAPGANVATKAGKQRGAGVVNPLADSNQISRLTRNYQNLQGTGQDAAMVQSAYNSLVDGLRMDGGGSVAGGSVGSGAEDNKGVQDLPSQGQPGSSEVDMDLLLKEFLNSNASTSGSTSSLTPATTTDSVFGNGDGIDAQTPDFAFSPHPNGTANDEGEKTSTGDEQRGTSSTGVDPNSASSTPGRNSPTPSTRKRKPAAFEGALGQDIERANAKAIKNARRAV